MTARSLVCRLVSTSAWLTCSMAAAAQPVGGNPRTTSIEIATWNLGWHMDGALAQRWIAECSQLFSKDPSDGLWKPRAGGEKTGWELRWSRGAPIQWDLSALPPCDVYQDRFKIVPVTAQAYLKRQQQISAVLSRDVRADILAFQEVSGAQAVRQILPNAGADFEICSFTGFKVQRLAIAWRRTLGSQESCRVFEPLALPQREPNEQPRPGLALTLNIEGKRLRLLTVHLKSSCVSPLEDPRPNGKGQLDGTEPNCVLLQAQVPALEAWVEDQARDVDGLALLGDFNRNLGHEARQPAGSVVRVPGQPTDAFTPDTKVRNLWREINDGAPDASRLTLLDSACELPSTLSALCEAGKDRVLSRQESAELGAPAALGCRNPLGLDHIAIGAGAMAMAPARKVPLGRLGRTLAATAARPDPLLGLSDHCPLAARIAF
jgi:hypothetical protein